MASPPEKNYSRSSALFTPKRLQSFRRPGKEGDAGAGEDAVRKGSKMDKLQVLIPGFERVDEEDGTGETVIKEQRRCEMAKTLMLSTGGRQSSSAHHLSAEDHEVTNDELDDIEELSNGPQSSTNDNGIDGRIVSTSLLRWCCSPSRLFVNLISHCTHLLSPRVHRQNPHKRIAVGEDVLGTYHESFLYGKVALSTRVRAGIRGPFLSSLLLLLECIAASLLLALYVRAAYTKHNPRWITIVQFCCSFFFLLDYLIKLYSAPVRLYYALSINGIIDLISTLPIYFILRW